MGAVVGEADSGREGELGREDSRIVEGASMPPFVGRGDVVAEVSSLLLSPGVN